MRRLALTTAVAASATVLCGLTFFALDPVAFSMSSVALISIGLLMSTLVALSGFLLVRAPWGRWGLAGTTGLSMLLASVNTSAAVIGVLAVGATTIVAIAGPWLRFWVRQFRTVDAPNTVATSLIAIAPVAPLIVGIGAYDTSHWLQWLAAGTATGTSFLYARAVPGAIWALRFAMPITAAAAVAVSPMPWTLAVGLAASAGTVAAWLPGSVQTTAMPSPVLPAPRTPPKEDDASQ